MANTTTRTKHTTKTHQNKNPNTPRQQKQPQQQSWAVFRSLLTCKHLQQQLENQKHHQQNQKSQEQPFEESSSKTKKMKCTGSLCNNTKVMHRAEPLSSSSPGESKKKVLSSLGSGNRSSKSMRVPLISEQSTGVIVSSSSSNAAAAAGTSRSGMPFRRFSGCYECRMVVDPVLGITRDPSLRSSVCSCPHCGEIFAKSENLELHQVVRHAVSELGAEDTSKNIVEMIFQSSWLKKEKQSPVCKIDRILKVQNTPKTMAKFEEYRDSIKMKCNRSKKQYPRCVADGNELLRFHSTSLVCTLGLNGSSNLCNSIPTCTICSIIKNGFRVVGPKGIGILTTATSGKADDTHTHTHSAGADSSKRAMLVCRVIAGRVLRKNINDSSSEEYDSVAGASTGGVYSTLEELYVFNPMAILPCFVVMYHLQLQT